MNALLDFSGLPRFGDWQPKDITSAMDQLLADGRAAVERALAAPVTWDGFVVPLEDANERIGRAWGQAAHLHAVLDSPELRDAYNANLPKITQYWTELGQNQQLFEKYKQLAASPEFGKLAGDVDFASVKEVAGWLTPVPGGVGPMTIAMLLENCIRAAGAKL